MKLISPCMNRCVIRLGILAACGLFAFAGIAGSWTATAKAQCIFEEPAKITASDGQELDWFGSAVAVSGDTVLVGASGDATIWYDDGSVYAFVTSGPPGLEVWVQQAKLNPADPSEFASFGRSVALSGDTAVIGAFAALSEEDTGAAYVFVRSGPPGGEVWTQQAKLTPPDPNAGGINFGFEVAVRGDMAVIGAPRDHEVAEEAGAVYVFVRSGPPGGETWTQQAKLTASDAEAGDKFGNSLALSDDTMVIGARYNDNTGGEDAGAAYVFKRAGGVWTEQSKLIASDGGAGDNFGASVSLSENTVAIGAWSDDHAGDIDAGSAYIFTRSGAVWSEQAKLIGSDTSSYDLFGRSIAVSGDRVVVGAWYGSQFEPGVGLVYQFTRSGPSGSEIWTEQASFAPPDASPLSAFGHCVVLADHTLVVGAVYDNPEGINNAGSAYIFDCPTPPGCPMNITASDAAAGDEFGIAAAIDEGTIIVGARFDDNATGNDAGAAYVYVKSGPPGSEVWTEQAKLIGEEPIFGLETGNQSGISVDVSGNTAFVGSWLWPQGNATGLIYIFGRSGPPGSEVWTQQFALQCPQFGSFQYYGYAVALEGDSAVVGSLDTPGGYGGSAYFAMRTGPVGGEYWMQQQVHPSDGVAGDQFGNSVAMSAAENTAVVGAFMDDNAGGTDAGSAYIFTRTGPSNNPWIEEAKLTASDGAFGDRFGVKVAISGDTVVVGAYLDDNAGGTDAGSAYVFTRSGTVWTQQAKLTASDAAPGDYFGVSLALSGDTVVIGAHGDDFSAGSDSGSAYVFRRSGPPGGEVWIQDLKLTSPDPAADDWFGAAVALAGDTPVIGARQDDHASGANAGSVYVFDLNCENSAICCTGDFDANSAVTLDDVSAFVDALLADSACPAAPDCCIADLNSDFLVNGNDVPDFVFKLLAQAACP